MKTAAEKLGWWFADVAIELLFVVVIALPMNFLVVMIFVWGGMPAHAGWPDPTLTQSLYIALFLALMDARGRRPWRLSPVEVE